MARLTKLVASKVADGSVDTKGVVTRQFTENIPEAICDKFTEACRKQGVTLKDAIASLMLLMAEDGE